MKPLVSLIMPVWQPRPDWLREAVASALDDETSLELLVVDDGCEEPVESLLRGIEDERLKVLRVGHGGPYAARNAGLRAAVGSYVRFVDCDDVSETGSTLRLLELADGRDDVVAYGATMMCDEALEPLRVVTSTLEGDVARACLLGEFHVYVVSMLFPSAVLARAGEWEEEGFRVSGDWDYVLRAVEHASVRRLDAVVTRYRRHGDSISSSADVAVGAEAGRLVLQRYFERHPEQRDTELARRAFARLHLERARAHAWRGHYRSAGREFASGARQAPRAAAAALAGWLRDRAVSLVAPAARRVLRGRR